MRTTTITQETGYSAEQAACRKAAWRIVPLLALAYFVNYLDRTNVGFAALAMNRDLGLTASQFGLAAGIFYVGYCFFEVPSNLALYRFGARRWLARIMITWGLFAAATSLATGPISYSLLRLLAGVGEAGFFPGVIFFLTLWFPARYRTQMMAWFLAAVPLSSVFSGPLSVSMLTLEGWLGLHGWQWLFILQGLPACLLGILCLKFLSDSPDKAHWLTAEERLALQAAVERERPANVEKHFVRSLLDWRVWLLTGILFSYIIGILGIGVWLPTILKTHDLGNTEIGLLTALPYVVGSVGMLLWGRVLARSQRYVNHLALTCGLAAIGFFCSVVSDDLMPAMAGLTIAVIGLSSVRTCFYSIPATFLGKEAAAGGLAFINSVGSLGGLVGPYIVGWLKDTTGSFKAGLIGMGAMLVLATVLTVVLLVIMNRKDAR